MSSPNGGEDSAELRPPKPPSPDLPSAANSRSIFKKKEEMQKPAPPKKESSVPSPPEPAPPMQFSMAQLSAVVRLVAVEAPSASQVDTTRLPVDSGRAVAEVSAAGNSIFAAVQSKLDCCVKLLTIPEKVGWKARLLSIAEVHPFALVDAVVDAINLVQATRGIWNLEENQPNLLFSQMDLIAVLFAECQRRLNQKAKKEENPQNEELPLTILVEALARLTSHLSACICSNLQTGSSLLSNVPRLDPVVAVLTGRTSQSKTSPFSSPKSSLGHTKPGAKITKLTGVSTPPELIPLSASYDNIGPFVKTVELLSSSDLCRRLFESAELRDALHCLYSVKAGLSELSQQRAFEWSSRVAQRQLPHHSTPLPSDPLLSSLSKVAVRVTRQSIIGEKKAVNSLSAACHAIQSLLSRQLTDLTMAFKALYRFIGSVLGGMYEDVEIQTELTDSSVLASYVTMVGFSFHHDLTALAQWMSPHMPEIRKKIKAQTAAVNAAQTPRATTPETPTADQPAYQPTTRTSAAALVALLGTPQEILLTRQVESDAILHLFCPHLKKARGGGSQIGAPADKVTRVLVWLAWEGGLMNIYEQLAPPSQTDPTEKPSNTVVEDAIVTAITDGCRIIRSKFGALGLLQATDDGVWGGRGEEVLDFALRVVEAVTLRYTGELEVRNLKETRGLPKWKSCLLTNTGKAIPKQASALTRVIESLPKLFGEYSHQSLFYSSPLRHERCASSSFESLVAQSTAATTRLTGATRDLDSRLTVTQQLAESATLNSHSTEASLHLLRESVTELSDQLKSMTEGPVDRHTNQLRTQSGRIEELAKDLQSAQGLLNSHKTRIESQQSDVKKCIDSNNEMKNGVNHLEDHFTKMAQDNMARMEAAMVQTMGSFVESHANKQNESAEILRKEALNLQEKSQSEMSIALSTQTEKTSACEARVAELEQKLAAMQKLLEDQQKEEQQREEKANCIKDSFQNLQSKLDNLKQGFVESIMSKCQSDLSFYLSGKLSQCVSNHVTYHLEKQQKQSSKRKLLSWVASPARNKENDDTPIKIQITPPSVALKPTQPYLIQSTHRHSTKQYTDDDDLTSLADSSAVMEEADQLPSPFPDVPFLVLPDPKEISFISEGRTPSHFNVDPSNEDSRKSATTESASRWKLMRCGATVGPQE